MNLKKKNEGIKQGLIYGLIPHVGCIAFIIGSILGANVLMSLFRPLLMNRFIFYYLILISIFFATISSIIYLKRNKLLSVNGIKKKKTYLSIMFGSTVGINLILFFIIFPLLTNVTLTGATSFDGDITNLETIKMSVNIPCSGHAPLISYELRSISGIINSKYSFPNNFEVTFNNQETSVREILSLDVFKEYPAKIT